MNFKFEGGPALEAALSEFSKVAAKNIARRALKTAAKPIADLAESLAPVRDTGSKTFKKADGSKGVRRKGALKSHVSFGTQLSKRQAGLNRKLGKAEVEAYVGTRDRIGRLAEFGTAEARAHPFIRPAWEAEGGQVALDRIAAELKVEIDKAAARAARKAMKGK